MTIPAAHPPRVGIPTATVHRAHAPNVSLEGNAESKSSVPAFTLMPTSVHSLVFKMAALLRPDSSTAALTQRPASIWAEMTLAVPGDTGFVPHASRAVGQYGFGHLRCSQP
jgi:hypothetical protein